MHSFQNFEPVQVVLDIFTGQMDNSFVSHLFKTIACFPLLNFLIDLSSVFIYPGCLSFDEIMYCKCLIIFKYIFDK